MSLSLFLLMCLLWYVVVGREGGGAESVSPGGVEFRQLRVKVAECCRGHAALIPGGSKSVLST